ncbi:MAG: response regulator transcription factor [Labilithrix sp.]
MRVLLVEDHKEVVEVVTRALVKDEHRVLAARSLDEADAAIATSTFDAIVLDLGLPDGSGLAWCKRVRGEGLATPILVLTAQSAVATRVSGLDSGADDFLPKPFAVAELRARVRALGRRAPNHTMRPFMSRDVQLDFSARRALVGGLEVPLTAREWKIVEMLTSRAGRVVRRSEILEAFWGDRAESSEASLEVLVGRIRKKLGLAFIRTVRGEGYATD